MALENGVPRPGRRSPRRTRSGRQTRFVPVRPVEPLKPDEPAIPPEQRSAEPAAPEQPREPTPDLGSLVHPKLPPGLVTLADLERHEREAEELRAGAAELRARLDTPWTPPPAPPARRRTPTVAPVARPLAGLLVAAGAVGLIVAGSHLPWPSGGQVDQAGPFAAVPLVAGPSGDLAPAAASAAAPAAPAPTGPPAGLGLPAGGPGIDAAGSALTLRLDGERLRVAQQIVLGPRGARDVVLTQPAVPGLSGDAAQLTPVVSGLQATVNGVPATVELTGSGWSVTPADGQRVRTLLLEYDLDGAVAVSTPSVDGRALGLVTPLAVAGEPAGPAQASSAAPQVIGISCPGAGADGALCGGPGAAGLRAAVPADAASQALLLQLDLERR